VICAAAAATRSLSGGLEVMTARAPLSPKMWWWSSIVFVV
jgi:hypothetical protein